MNPQITSLAHTALAATLACGATLATYATGCTVNGVQYQILVDREFAAQAVLETSTFRSGEKFRLQITPQQDCYAYLLNCGSSGAYKVLFPLPQINGGSNFISADQSVMIPPAGGYQFDEHSGLERLVLCVSRQAHPKLEELARAGFSDAATTEAVLAQLEQANRKESSFVKTFDEDRTRVCLVARHPDAVLVCRITLRHEPREDAGIRPRRVEPPHMPTSAPSPGRTERSDLAAAPGGNPRGPVLLQDAVRQRLVTVDVSGEGLSSVRLRVARQQPTALRVLVPVGTYFANQGGAQSMMSTAAVTLDLATQEADTVAVPSVCADFDRPQPDSRSRFAVNGTSDARLRQLAQVIERRRPSPVVAQVAVWAVVNNVSRGQLNGAFLRMQYVGGAAVHSGPAATDADIAAARSLVKEAGLDVSAFRLFR